MAATLQRALVDEAATTALGQDIALALRPGDILALSGDLGAGKTTLARAIIRALAGDADLDVPSPTFTLVQTYDGHVPISHFDLYRLSLPSELDELGLDEALADGAALIEWPERAGNRLPRQTIGIALAHEGDGRRATITGQGAAFDRIARTLAIRDFLDDAGFAGAMRRALTGDASARSYEVVSLPGKPDRLLMNSPALVLGPPVRGGKAYAEIARSARSVHAFVAIDRALAEAGFCVPRIDGSDLEAGLLLVEHLGEETLIDGNGAPVIERYLAAAALLADMHRRDWSRRIEIAPGLVHTVPPFDREAMLIEADLLVEWYLPAFHGQPVSDVQRDGYRAAWNAVLDRLDPGDTTLMLRDVQSPNFIWRPWLTGHDRLGLIDFQDALIGPPAYDVASLALDPRVTITAEFESAVVAAYVAARRRHGGFDEKAFASAYAIMGAQRHSKILGIFVRLDRRDGKPHYLFHLPRIRAYLRRVLAHPALAEVRNFYQAEDLLREPVA